MCDILSRFDAIWIVGDSFMRQITLAFMPFLRGDLVNGARRTWGDQPTADTSCACGDILENHDCFPYSLWNTEEVWENQPESMVCRRNTAHIQCECPLQVEKEVKLIDYDQQTTRL